MKSKMIINDGEFEIVKITEDLYDQAIELYQKYFMKYENVSIATNLLGSQQSIDEMETLIRAVISDGVSFAAKHRETNELVAMCVNMIINPSANCGLDEVIAKFKTPSMQYVGEYLDRMENTFDLFKEWQIDCAFEIVFLSTRSDFGRRGLAVSLAQFSIDYARQMLHCSLQDQEMLPLHVRAQKPKAVCSVFTSLFSQKVGQKVGMQAVNRISNTEFVYEGKTFAEKIDKVHEFSVFAAMRL